MWYSYKNIIKDLRIPYPNQPSEILHISPHVPTLTKPHARNVDDA